jgi:hypothetical protein
MPQEYFNGKIELKHHNEILIPQEYFNAKIELKH